jgi:hypothetical protein
MMLEKRRLLVVDAARRRYWLRALHPALLACDPREDYGVLSGEALCQYVLQEDPGALVIARGPLPFLAGNKTTVGYISPLTGLPHYSFVGGRGFAALFNLGLDAIVFATANGRMGESANGRMGESANGRMSEAANHESRIRNHESPINDYRLPIPDPQSLVTDYQSPVTDYQLLSPHKNRHRPQHL